MNNYIIVKAYALRRLESDVQSHANEGYTPLGGPVVIEESIVQALWKKPAKKARSAPESAYPPEFEQAWAAYPKRAGNNPKAKAYAAWKARVDAVSDYLQQTRRAYLLNCTQSYAAYCKATAKTGTEYVMQAATFFGPSMPYDQDWTIPTDTSPPKNDDELVSWARSKGLSEALPGESFAQYRRRLEQEL